MINKFTETQVKEKGYFPFNDKNQELIKDTKKRDFLVLTTNITIALGVIAATIPFFDSMNPAKDVQSAGSIEVDLSAIKETESKVITWRGKPIFIHHLDSNVIKEEDEVVSSSLIDPTVFSSKDRVKDNKWLVVVGVCTHLGCVPIRGGDYAGWLCPCHSSHYDRLGRIRKGPAPSNLAIPKPITITDNILKLG